MKKTIIVMPVSNEGESMRNILNEILALPYDDLYVYTVIDSSSTDNTEQIIDEEEANTGGKVHKVFCKESKGICSCYYEGFRQALFDGAERVIEMGGGGCHSPKEIPQFIKYLDSGYDCVWGSRYIKGGGITNTSFFRRLISKGGTKLANMVLGTKLKDMTSGFEAFQKGVLKKFDFNNFLSTDHMYQTEMRFYCRNYTSIEVPIHYDGGASANLKKKSIREALDILHKLKNNEPHVFR